MLIMVSECFYIKTSNTELLLYHLLRVDILKLQIVTVSSECPYIKHSNTEKLILLSECFYIKTPNTDYIQ